MWGNGEVLFLARGSLCQLSLNDNHFIPMENYSLPTASRGQCGRHFQAIVLMPGRRCQPCRTPSAAYLGVATTSAPFDACHA